MSAGAFVPGRQPTSFARRLLQVMRPVPSARVIRIGSPVTGRITSTLPRWRTAQPVTTFNAPDPFPDLQDATWEDAEWQ